MGFTSLFLTNQVVAWPVQSDQSSYGVISGRNDWLSSQQGVVIRFLTALAQAEDYLVRNPTAAKAIVQKRIKVDDTYMNIFWREYQFSLSLDQSLVLAMEDEARWLIKNNLTEAEQVPNFLDYLYLDGLKTVRPEAVNIIQ